jgi:glyoxylase-like metal-dependent hydrolase (beta-lactamase superfamily II)
VAGVEGSGTANPTRSSPVRHRIWCAAPGKIILIDTASANGKERPYFPLSSHLDTPYIQDLGRAGVKPEDVDIVVCTHLHFDHVGWNTVLENREWIPTFANATYLFTSEDFDAGQ